MPASMMAAVNPRYFLNRLALEHSTDCITLDPLTVIPELLSNNSLPAMQQMFEDFCEAAIAPAYCWKDRDPEPLLRFSRDLEKLIEACYLLYRDKKLRSSSACPKAVSQFFAAYPLPEWKRILRDWTQAALSPCSVAEIGVAKELIPFVRETEGLIGGAFLIGKKNDESESSYV